MPLIFASSIPRSLRTFARAEAQRLGLADWQIEIMYCEGEKLDKYHSSNLVLGDVVFEVPHRSALMNLRKGSSVSVLKRYIAHELRHLTYAPLDLIVRQAWRKKLTWAQFEEIWDDAVETAIETELNARAWR